ncbi:MAG: PUR family DNA/RNA-binding protein [Chitinophagales bacterium]|nr:PUR family DNA/RNA-binding protein [Chitinophagales bacterium]
MEQRDNQNIVYSHKVRAGKKRTYFFDVKSTKYDDFFIIITEHKRRFDSDTFERHKIFLYKEDFLKFMNGLQGVIEHVTTNLMPDYDFKSTLEEDKGDLDNDIINE